jgi:hypothetical protein
MYKKNVYIAGFPESCDASDLKEEISAIENMGYNIVNLRKIVEQENSKKELKTQYNNKKESVCRLMEIGKKNYLAIKDCDCIIAMLGSPYFGSGSAADIGYGFAIGKPIVGYVKDNQSTDVFRTKNASIYYYIEASGGKVIHKPNKLVEEIKRLTSK